VPIKQPFGGEFWDEPLHHCTRHKEFTTYNRGPYCFLCKISELEQQRDMAYEEIGLLKGQIEGIKEGIKEDG